MTMRLLRRVFCLKACQQRREGWPLKECLESMKGRKMVVLVIFYSLPEKKKHLWMIFCEVTADASADAVAMDKEFTRTRK